MNSAQNNNPLDKRASIISALAIAIIGALFYNVLPLFLGAAQDSRSLSNQQIGLIGSSFYAGYNLIIISAFFWIRKVDWRQLGCFALPVTAGGLAMAALTESYGALLASVFIAGGASSVLYGLATTIIGDTSHATRWFGVKIALEGAMGAILLFTLPALIVAHYGFNGLVVALAVITLCCTPFLLFLPRQGIKVELAENGGTAIKMSDPDLVAVWAAIIATALFFTGESAAWAFMERIGNDVGIAAGTLGIVLGVTLVFAAFGSFAAAAYGERYKFVWTILATTLMYFVSMAFLSNAETFTYYVIGACLFTFSFGFGIALYVSFTSALDLTGHYVVLTVPAIGIGAMVGPGLAGWLTTAYGFNGLIVASAALIAASLILVVFATFTSQRKVD